MARQVIWSHRAQMERKNILSYWNNRNKSNAYSKKLNQLFKVAAKLIAVHPQLGKPTDIKNIRIKIIREYLMIYEVTTSRIEIHSIWDSRQDPQKIAKGK